MLLENALVVVHHRPPAIDHQASGVDKGRLVGRQEQCCHGHFDGLANAFGRVQVERTLAFGVGVWETVPVIDVELGFDIAGGDGIHADALGRVLDAQGTGEAEQAVLGHG